MVHEGFFHIPFSHLVVPKVLAFREDAQSSLFNRLMKYRALDPELRRPFAAYGRSTFKQNQLEMLTRTVLYENLRSKGCGKQKEDPASEPDKARDTWLIVRVALQKTSKATHRQSGSDRLENQPTDPAAAGRYACYL